VAEKYLIALWLAGPLGSTRVVVTRECVCAESEASHHHHRHLINSFIIAANYDEKALFWQTLIPMAFLFSAMPIAACDRILPKQTSAH